MKVMVGGTFDPLHDGHKKLLERSFEIAGRNGFVTVGVTADGFANRKAHPIRPFEIRKSELVEFLNSAGYSGRYEVEVLNDRFGSALESDFDALVVSEETFKTGVEINEIRKEKGQKKVDLHQITCVLADDGKWISSTRIWNGEIDNKGRLVNKK
jgi:pantetheine-phosphate adenylyltransferase